MALNSVQLIVDDTFLLDANYKRQINSFLYFFGVHKIRAFFHRQSECNSNSQREQNQSNSKDTVRPHVGKSKDIGTRNGDIIATDPHAVHLQK